MSPPVAGAEPELEKYAEIAAAAGLSCQKSQEPRPQFTCELGDGTTPRVLSAGGTDNLDGSYYLSVDRYAHPDALAPAEPDVIAIMQDFIELTLDSDAEAIEWLAEMNAGPQAEGYLPQGDWSLSWHADASIVGLAMVYYRTGPDQPEPGTPSMTEPPTSTPQHWSTVGTSTYTGTWTLATYESHPPGQDPPFELGSTPFEGTLIVTCSPEAMCSIEAARAGELVMSGPTESVADGQLRRIADTPNNCGITTFNVEFGELNARAFDSTTYDTDRCGDFIAVLTEGYEFDGELTDYVSVGIPDVVPAGPSEAPAPAPVPAAGHRTFAASVPKPAEVSVDPAVLLQSAALAALLVFLMPFPSQLFNSTLEAHEGEVRRWLRLDRIGSAVGKLGAFWGSWPGVAIFTLLAALLYGFLDPGFGLSLGSLATFLGMLVGIVLVTAAFAVPVVLAHRRLGDRWKLKVVPVSLLIGVACVLLSRLTGFEPGYLYGLLIGLAFARELSAADEGRATAIGAAVMLAVAFAAWLGLGAMPEGEGFALVVLRTSLAALMVAGLEGVVFGLLPMRFLPGEPLYAWNRILWGTLLAVGAFAFFHILINPASGYLSDSSRTPLFTVVALLVGFSLVSVAFWAWFRFRGGTPADEQMTA